MSRSSSATAELTPLTPAPYPSTNPVVPSHAAIVSRLALALLAQACSGSGSGASDAMAQPSSSPPSQDGATPAALASSVPAGSAPAGSARLATAACREQRAQAFLLRKGQLARPRATAAERREIEAARRRSEDYRTREYGRFPGFGKREDNPHAPSFYALKTTFVGLPIVMNRKVVPALACVEQALGRDCAAQPYVPRQIGGMRYENTYADYEVSNHVYGIAIDVDPGLNPCCGCTGSWSHAPACKKQVRSPSERMVMPSCWVEVFERHGFYWLGHDELGDTMHFEFLGDPDRIVEPPIAAAQ